MEAFLQKSVKFITYSVLVAAGAIFILLGMHDKKRALGETTDGAALSLFAEEAYADFTTCSGDSSCGGCGDGMCEGSCGSDDDDDGDGDGDGV